MGDNSLQPIGSFNPRKAQVEEITAVSDGLSEVNKHLYDCNDELERLEQELDLASENKQRYDRKAKRIRNKMIDLSRKL